MITIKDMVSMRYGKTVADDLANDGLLARDGDAIDPTGWRVKVKDTGKCVLPTNNWQNAPKVPHSLGFQLSAPLWKLQYPNSHHDDCFEASQDFDTDRAARRQAKMASKCGLEVEIVPLTLIELPLLKYTV